MKKALSMFLLCLMLTSTFMLTQFLPEAAADGEPAVLGTNWTKNPNNPLMSWPVTAANEHCIIFKDNLYRMWYASTDGNIGYAISSDGVAWSDFGQVLAKGPAEWESKTVRDPWVLFNGTYFLMWYQGYVDYPSGDGFSQIGFAWSTNGVSWTKHGTPVLARGSSGWDSYGVLDPTVTFDGSTYKLWYLGRSGWGSNPFSVGYATSTNGIIWTRYAGNPVLTRGESGAWDSLDLYSLSIVKSDNGYSLFYGGEASTNEWRIGLATSSDGISWQKHSANPVLNVGSGASWESQLVVNPCAIRIENGLKMWYIGSDGVTYKGGLAETSGLAGYWKFDEASGTTVYDSSGNANTGTVHGAQWVQGVSGQALSFDGVNDYVSIPHSTSIDVSGNEITVEYWVQFPTAWYAGCSSESLILYDKGDAYTASMTGSTGKHRFNIPYVFPYPESNKDSWDANVWYHIADVFDGSQIRIYINGVLDKTEPVIGSVSRSSLLLAIGSHCFGDSNFFKGTIDEFKIYSYARTADEIQADYQAPLVGYWRFDEGTGNIAGDSSGKGNNGIIHTATWTNGKMGKALHFNGADSWVQIPNSPSLSGFSQITIEAWIREDNVATAVKGIVSKCTGIAHPTYDAEYYLGLYGEDLAFHVSNYNYIAHDTVPGAINEANRWYHLAATWSGDSYAIYVDGVPRASGTCTPQSTYSNGIDLQIGRHGTWSWVYFQGVIDEVKIYNYARTIEQIKEDYSEGAPQRFSPENDGYHFSNYDTTKQSPSYWDAFSAISSAHLPISAIYWPLLASLSIEINKLQFGNCFGMSYTAKYYYENPNSFAAKYPNYDKLNSLPLTIAQPEILINQFPGLETIPPYLLNFIALSLELKSLNEDIQWMIEQIDSGHISQLSLFGPNIWHSVLVYDYEPKSITTEVTLEIYDPNRPNLPSYITLLKDDQGNFALEPTNTYGDLLDFYEQNNLEITRIGAGEHTTIDWNRIADYITDLLNFVWNHLKNIKEQTLGIRVDSPVNILLTDPSGKKVGFDTSSAQIVNEIQGATYTGPNTEPQLIIIPSEISGDYTIKIVGTGTGNYAITIESIEFDGSISDSKILFGTTSIGKTEIIAIYLADNGELQFLDIRGVEINADSLTVETAPGHSVLYSTSVRNTGNVEDDYILTLEGLNPAWYYFSQATTTIDSGQTKQVTLTILPPYLGVILKDYDFMVTATSQNDPEVHCSITATLNVAYTPSLPTIPSGGLVVAVQPKTTATSAGNTVVMSIRVTNNENFDDAISVKINVNGIAAQYQADLAWFNWTSLSVFVPSKTSYTIQLSATIPDGTAVGTRAFKVEVSSAVWSKGYAMTSGGIIIR